MKKMGILWVFSFFLIIRAQTHILCVEKVIWYTKLKKKLKQNWFVGNIPQHVGPQIYLLTEIKNHPRTSRV